MTTRVIGTTGPAAAVLGIVLFVWYVDRVGVSTILDGLRQVGWGLTLITAIAGLRFGSRALAWSLCLEPPHRLPFSQAFAAVIAGDAFGNLTPLGPLVGEPTKAAFIRDRVPLAPALTALAVENLLYTLSAATMIAAGTIALLFTFELPEALREASELATLVILVALAASMWVLWRRPALVSRGLAALPGASGVQARVDRVRALEEEIYTFASRRRVVLVPVICAELGFHGLGVLEVHLTWWLMQGSPPPLLTSFILEAANRLINVVFKVVPLRFGVDEAGTATFTRLLGFGEATGATLAIVRKVRVLFWTLAGTILLVRRGLSPRRILEHPPLDVDRVDERR